MGGKEWDYKVNEEQGTLSVDLHCKTKAQKLCEYRKKSRLHGCQWTCLVWGIILTISWPDLSLSVSVFSLVHDTFSLASLILIYSAVLLGTGLLFSLCPSICCFQNYSLSLFRTATEVFKIQEKLSSLQQVFHKWLFLLIYFFWM